MDIILGCRQCGRLAWPCREASTVQEMRGKRRPCFWVGFLDGQASGYVGWVSQLGAVISLAPKHDFLVPRAPEDPHAPSSAADLCQACWGCREHDDPFPGRWTIWDLIPQAFSLQISFCSDFSSHRDMPGANCGLACPGLMG